MILAESLIYDAAKKLWQDSAFQSNFTNLKLANVKHNLSIKHQACEPIDFSNLLRAASIFSLIKDIDAACDMYHEAAFRIAYISAKIWSEKPENFETIIAIILGRIGNFPTVKKQLANDNLDFFISKLTRNLPHSFALETLARYEGNIVQVGSENNKETLALTDFQRKLWCGLDNEKNLLSFSSPTSSGKTFLLQQFITNKAASSPNKFIAIYVVPTRALIAEISHSIRNLIKTKDINDIEVLSVGSDIEQNIPTKVIYVFTQERLLSFLATWGSQNLTFIDYIIIDEAHQISEKVRGTLLHQSLNWLKNSYTVGKFIFCSPVISNPNIFEDLMAMKSSFASENHITRSSPVTQNLLIVESVKSKKDNLRITLHDSSGEKLVLSDALKIDAKRSDDSKSNFLAYCAFNLGKDKRNIIYVDGPDAADDVAKKLIKIINKECNDSEILDASSYISNSIHSEFVLAKALRSRIGIHYGKMPSLVRETVERLFRDEKLEFMICTSTLAQGVNLPVQNLFILDPKIKNPDTNESESIPRASFWNIVGRAGRLYKDFEGNVFLLKQPSKQENWEDLFLNTEKLTAVIPATQNVVLEQHEDLIRHITNPEQDAKKGIEEVASFIYDLSRSKESLNHELSWIKNLSENIIDELKISTDEASHEITLPYTIIKKNVGISPIRQQALYNFLCSQMFLEEWILPRNLASIKDLHKVVSRILHFLDTPTMKPEILEKYTWLYVSPAFDWISGKPLNQMINNHLQYWKKKKKVVSLTPEQTNSCIRDLFDQIENKVRFKLVKYINCYNNVYTEVCIQKKRGDLIEKIPMHLPLFLEVGASNPVQIDLMSIGLSRMTALELSSYIPIDSYNRNIKLLQSKIKTLTERNIAISKICVEEIKRHVF
ncbi:hypothetical protein CBP51_10515 [Cellvibrio mixtus]|uniref:DEAD/DEAH box helicase n=2 Tax=Cellvibrio mixtus TaxID=39650 RepID=A0A266QCL9_9GAMM|nr:hypothetical protein CBP51_10515 [Cellvibrio mixtus]